ncbi:MAG: tetratricopeptide repeat protein [Gammaproteobacteria bacterium]|jgi:TPR repeat protein
MRVNPIITSRVFVLILAVVSFTALADNYEAGLVAFAQGDYQTAEQHFLSAAEQGDAGAKHMLMRLYTEHNAEMQRTAHNDKQALYWTQQAARSGIVSAQYALAEHYNHPAASREERQRAVHWYQQAVHQGHHGAMEKLADFYQRGDVVQKDAERAQRLYVVAASEYDVFAQKGDPAAQNALAGMYENAKGVAFNIQAALNWYKKAALQDFGLAQYNLGRLYAQGEHVEKNEAEAVYWLQKAAAQGLEQARVMLTGLQQRPDTSLAMK